jgi:hypothetical protein
MDMHWFPPLANLPTAANKDHAMPIPLAPLYLWFREFWNLFFGGWMC